MPVRERCVNVDDEGRPSPDEERADYDGVESLGARVGKERVNFPAAFGGVYWDWRKDAVVLRVVDGPDAESLRAEATIIFEGTGVDLQFEKSLKTEGELRAIADAINADPSWAGEDAPGVLNASADALCGGVVVQAATNAATVQRLADQEFGGFVFVKAGKTEFQSLMTRMRTTPVPVSVIGAAMVAGVWGAAASEATPKRDPASIHQVLTDYPEKAAIRPWEPAPPAPDERVYPGFGLRTLPAPADATPEVTRAEVLDIASESDFAQRGLLSGDPSVELRRIITEDFEGQEAVEGPLSWVLTYRGSPAVGHGRYSSEGKVAVDPAAYDCQFTYAVDARTADETIAIQNCDHIR